MIFQYGFEPVLIQWILIGFEAIYRKTIYIPKMYSSLTYGIWDSDRWTPLSTL